MKRILIIGSPGSGKSTLSRELAKLLGIQVVHLDALYWRPGWKEPSKEEWASTIHRLLDSTETWIMDGHYGGTLDMRLGHADTVIFLTLPRTTCLRRVIQRRFQHRGQTRPDMAEGCPEKIDLEFLKYVWEFQRKRSNAIQRKLNNLREQKTIIVLKTPKEVEGFLQEVRTLIPSLGMVR